MDARADDFDTIWNQPALRDRLAAFDAGKGGRAAGLLTTTLLLVAATVIGAVVALVIWPPLSIVVLLVGGVFILAKRGNAKQKVADDLKAVVLPSIAESFGLTYSAAAEPPDGLEPLRKHLFGGADDARFTDRFAGRIEDRDVVIYEADISEEVGQGDNESTHTLFAGQVLLMSRRAPGRGRTFVGPDQGLFNKKERLGLERVEVNDPDFEKKFQIYSDNEAEAQVLLGSSSLRAELLRLREAGRAALFLDVRPGEVLALLPGENRFEVGDLGKKGNLRDRAQRMHGEVRETVALVRRLAALLP